MFIQPYISFIISLKVIGDWEKGNCGERAFESSPRIIITGDLNVNLLIENDHRLNQIINIFNLINCIREPTRLGALLDPILFSDELETTVI
jgi:hypothetical protein